MGRHKPGGGDKKIESRKLEWNVTSKVGSTKNLKHRAGGGNVKIHDAKLEIKAESRIGSLANVGHRAGGGEKKIFDDKEHSRQMREFQSAGPSSTLNSARGSTHDRRAVLIFSRLTSFTIALIQREPVC